MSGFGKSRTSMLAALTLVGLALATGVAQGAQTVTTLPYVPAGGPVLAGAAVALLDLRADLGYDVTLNQAGLSPRKVVSIPPAVDRAGQAVELLASPSRLVLGLSYGPPTGDPNGNNTAFNVLQGPLGGPVAELGQGCGVGEVALSGESLSHPGPHCDTPEIVDYSTDQPTTMMLPQGVHDVQLAGRYAAWLAPTGQVNQNSIVVFDRSTRSVVYEIPPSVSRGGGSLALQDDGKLAVSYNVAPVDTPSRTQVAWASPAQPTLHVVPSLKADLISVKLDHDQLAAVSKRLPGFINVPTLMVSDLTGAHQRVVASPVEGFDAKDGELAWTVPGCLDATVRRASATDPTADVMATHCPLGLSTRVLHVHGRRHRVSVNLSCRGLSRLCYYAEVLVRGLARHGREGRVLARGTTEFFLSGGVRNVTAQLTLTRSGRRLLARHRRVAVSVIATEPQVGGPRRARATLIAG